MAAEKADVLMMGPLSPMIVDGIAEAFTLHKLWEAPDRDRLIAELAPRLRAMAAGGGFHDLIVVPDSELSRIPFEALPLISAVGPLLLDHILGAVRQGLARIVAGRRDG